MNTQEKIKQTIQKKSNLKLDGNGYVESPEDNLIMAFPNWQLIKNDLQKGKGGELKKGSGKIKFCAAHSSSCLCVNNFALIKAHVREVDLFGLGKFLDCNFEKSLSTGVRSAKQALTCTLQVTQQFAELNQNTRNLYAKAT